MISQAPSIGASPTTNSSDRSNFPANRISVSAITTTDSSDDCCRMLRKLSVVRKASDANAPMIMTRMITGISVSSRKPRNVLRLRGVAGRFRTASACSLGIFDSFDRRHQRLALPTRSELGGQTALEDDKHAVAHR